jgi:LCP family protein required for cell wall assembly
MMLVHADPSRDRLYLISLPRDLWVPIPGHGTNKINAAYAFGGAPLAVRTVENLLKIHINHVALTDFEGFFNLIDDLGGVTVFNEIPSEKDGVVFPRGDLKLGGKTALLYVRERYDLPRGDFDRAERQRLVIKAIVDKLASSKTLTDPSKLLAVIGRLSKSVTLDDSLTNKRIIALVQTLQLTSDQVIDQFQVPVAGFGTSAAGANYVKPNNKRMSELAAALNSGQLSTYQP